MALLQESVSPLVLTKTNVREQPSHAPAVTIILVTWNRKEELVECLHSLEMQRLRWDSPAELIVIDDGSDDGTSDFLSRYSWVNGPYSSWRLAKNQGPGLARNFAISHASAPFLFFMDTDCLLQTRDGLWRLLCELRRDQKLAVVAPRIWSDVGHVKPPFLLGGYLTRAFHADLPRWQTEVENPHFLSTCCSLWRTECIAGVGGFDPFYGHGVEDADACLRVVKEGGKLKVIDRVHAVHSLSPNGRRRQADDFDRVYRYLEWTRPYLFLRINGLRGGWRDFARWPSAGKEWWNAYGRTLTITQKLWGRALSPLIHLLLYPFYRFMRWDLKEMPLPREAELIVQSPASELPDLPAQPPDSIQLLPMYDNPEIYDHSYFGHDPGEDDFWVQLAEEAGGKTAKVLEIGAGTGRLALALARAGMSVTALDSSNRMLHVLDISARAENISIKLLNGDIRQLEVDDGPFDFLFGGLGIGSLLRTAGEAGEFFRRAATLLRPGGRLALHVCLATDPQLPTRHESTWTAGTRAVRTRSWFRFESIDSADASFAHYEYQTLGLTSEGMKLLNDEGDIRLFHAAFVTEALKNAPDLLFVGWLQPYIIQAASPTIPTDVTSAILLLERQEVLAPVFMAGFREPTDAPVEFADGDGCHLTDSGGRRYLDFSSQYINVNLGHRHPGLQARMHDAVDRHLFLNLRFGETSSQRRLVNALTERMHGNYSGVQFTASGTMAIEAALKVARQVTGRQKVISLRQSYHGMSYGALSATGCDEIVLPFGPRDSRHILVNPPRCSICPYSLKRETCGLHCAKEVIRLIEEQAPGIAAIVAEPVISNQVIVPPPEFWPEIVQACRKHGILIIADEVVSGFGRCGDWNGSQRVGLEPDILVLGKGMTSGLVPFAAVMYSPAITAHYEGTTLLHGQTFDGYDLGCRAALAVIEVIEEGHLLNRVEHQGQFLSDCLNDLAGEFPGILSVRGWGLLWGLEITPHALPDADVHSFAISLQRRLVTSGLLLGGLGRVLIIAPPFIVDEELIRQAVEKLRLCLRKELGLTHQ